MKDPLISVIVPAHNVGKYIAESLHSILSQTLEAFELIVIDDGSTDNTQAIVQQIARKDDRIRLLTQYNSGVSSARNRGLEESQAPFIAFVDGDDIIRPYFLDQLYDAIQDADMSVIGVENLRGNHDWSPRRQLVDNLISNREDFLHLYRAFSTGAWEFPNWNKLFRKDIIKEQGIRFNESLAIGEDRLFNLEYLMNCTSVRTIGTMGYGYRLRPDSAYRGADPYTLWSNHCRAMEATISALARLPEAEFNALKPLFITSPTIHTAFPQLLDGLKKHGSTARNLEECLEEAQRIWFNPRGLSLSPAAFWLFKQYSSGRDWPATSIWKKKIS